MSSSLRIQFINHLILRLIDPEAKLPEKTKESVSDMMLRLTGIDITLCPQCKKGKMIAAGRLSSIAWNTS